MSKPILAKKQVEVVVVAPPAQSMAERLRLHTVRRLGHFVKGPVRLVPTMTPQEVARHRWPCCRKIRPAFYRFTKRPVWRLSGVFTRT